MTNYLLVDNTGTVINAIVAEPGDLAAIQGNYQFIIDASTVAPAWIGYTTTDGVNFVAPS